MAVQGRLVRVQIGFYGHAIGRSFAVAIDDDAAALDAVRDFCNEPVTMVTVDRLSSATIAFLALADGAVADWIAGPNQALI